MSLHFRRYLVVILSLWFLPHGEGQYPPQEVDPEFLAPLENHTVSQGRDVSFTCVVNHLGPYKVAWIKADTKAILGIHNHMVAHNPRLSVTHNGHNTWKLHVSSVQRSDAGEYMCQINTDPMKTQMGYLEVVIPPDILSEESSEDGVALEGSNLQMKCKATGLPDPTVVWRREDSKNIILRADGSRDKQVVRTVEGEILLLTNVVRSDMGNYLCIATNGVPPSVSKRFAINIHFLPLIKVSNQLVAAPAGSDVTVQCYIEASPKAMNSWHRETGEKLVENSNKYVITETPLNEYALTMNLTIKNLEKRDFGGYLCTSSNALGRAEGGVRLQELKLPPVTTTVAAPRPQTPSHKAPKQHKERRRKWKKTNEDGGDDESDEATTMAAPPSVVEAARPSAPPAGSPPRTTRHPAWVVHDNDAAAPKTSASLLAALIAALGAAALA